jgi:LysR family transcriptional activator of mexEF-oprN operon
LVKIRGMKRLNLLNIDLNLLVSFDALVIERSVSRAAKRVGVSQPAMSRSLGLLRGLLGDPLFRRSSNGMVPTPRAIELAKMLRPSLENIDSVLGQKMGFDPATSDRRFTIAMPDLAAGLALPTLLRLLRTQAPGIDLAILSTGNREGAVKVENGQAEFGMGVYEHLPPALSSINLRELTEVCIADPGSEFAKRNHLSLEDFLSASHIAVSMNDDFGTPIDTALETMGLRRRIAVRTPYFSSVPQLVLGTDLLAVVQEELLDAFPDGRPLARFPIPLSCQGIMSKLIWHARSEEDAGHLWLRELIKATLSSDALSFGIAHERPTVQLAS